MNIISPKINVSKNKKVIVWTVKIRKHSRKKSLLLSSVKSVRKAHFKVYQAWEKCYTLQSITIFIPLQLQTAWTNIIFNSAFPLDFYTKSQLRARADCAIFLMIRSGLQNHPLSGWSFFNRAQASCEALPLFGLAWIVIGADTEDCRQPNNRLE